MFGKKAREIQEQAAKIADLQSQIAELVEKNEILQQRLDVYTAKENAIVKALTDANERAEKVVSDAQFEAGSILQESEANAEAARQDAEKLVNNAYQNARDIVKKAEDESQEKLDETQSQIEAYAALLGAYDKMVQDNIKTAQEQARRYAEMAQQLHLAVPQILSPEGKLNELPQAGEEAPAQEPEEEAKPEKEEKLWKVSDISDAKGEDSLVDEIIDGILGAAGNPAAESVLDGVQP